MTLKWERFSTLTSAREQYSVRSCVYIQADDRGRPHRVGMASRGLRSSYFGGTGYAMDAAMNGRGRVYVAAVESELIWQGRQCLPYNNLGKKKQPKRWVKLVHDGRAPDFSRCEG